MSRTSMWICGLDLNINMQGRWEDYGKSVVGITQSQPCHSWLATVNHIIICYYNRADKWENLAAVRAVLAVYYMLPWQLNGKLKCGCSAVITQQF